MALFQAPAPFGPKLGIKLFQVRLCSISKGLKGAAFVWLVPSNGKSHKAPIPGLFAHCRLIIKQGFSLVVGSPVHFATFPTFVPDGLVPLDLFQGLSGDELPDLLQGALSSHLTVHPGDDPDMCHLQNLFQGIQIVVWKGIIHLKGVVPVNDDQWHILFQGIWVRLILFQGCFCP